MVLVGLSALTGVYWPESVAGVFVVIGLALILAGFVVYGAVLLIALGWSLVESPLGLLPTAALAVVFDLKARVEEAWLEERFPGYSQYRDRTPRRFVPGVY